MAMLIGFEQDPSAPPGMGQFHFDDGSSQYAEDPALAQRLSGAPDQRVAGPGGGPAAAPAPPEITPPSPYLPESARYTGPAPGAVGSPLGSVQTPPAMQRVAAPAAPVALEAAKPMGPPPPPGPSQGPPPAPRVSWGAQQGGPVPGSYTQSVEGQGRPFSQEDAEAFRELNLNRIAAEEEKAKREAAQAQAESLHYQAQIPALQQQAARAQMQQDVIQGAVNNEEQGLRALVEDANQKKRQGVQPNHLFQERGALASIGMAIAQGMGAYAAAITHTQNFAQQIVDRAIDRDIAAQERAIDDSQGAANNALAQLQRRYGNLEQSKAALRVLQHEAANAELKSWESQAKAGGTIDTFNVWLATNQQQQAERLMQFRDKSMQKVTTNVSGKIVQPRAAGSRPMTEDEMLQRQYKTGKLRADVAEQENRLEGYQGGEPALKPKEQVKTAENYGKKKEDLSNARTTANQLAGAYGVSIDWKTGQVVKPKDWGGISGQGIDRPFRQFSPGGRDVDRAQKAFTAAKLRAISGASTTPEEYQRTLSYTIGMTDEDAVKALQAQVEELNAHERDVESSYPRGIVKGREQRAAEVNRERAQPSPKLEPY